MSMDMHTYAPFIAAGLASAAILLIVSALARLLGNRNRLHSMKRRVDNATNPARSSGRGLHANALFRNGGAALANGAGVAEQAQPSALRLLLARFASAADRMGEHLSPTRQDELTEANLSMVRAGFANPARANRIFWGVKGGLVLVGLLSASAVCFTMREQIPPALMALIFIFPAVLGMYIPNIWLRMRTTRRRRAITNALPDALDLLVVCVESGMGIDQAINRIAREMRATNPELSGELNTVILELRAGKSRTDALKNLARRVGLEDMNSLVTLIVQADTFGTSIAATLRVYSDHMRTTRYQRAEEIAAKLPVKMLFPLIFFILPALFVAIMGPAGIQLMNVFSKL